MTNVTLTNEQFQALLVAAREGGAANSTAGGSGSSKAAKPSRPSVDMDTQKVNGCCSLTIGHGTRGC